MKRALVTSIIVTAGALALFGYTLALMLNQADRSMGGVRWE